MAQIQNLSAFQRSLSRALSTLQKDQIPLAIKKITFDAFRGFVLHTRVDSGRARGGWTVSKNTPGGKVKRLDKTGAATMSEALGKLTDIKIDDIIIISNGVEYILILENLDHMIQNTLNGLIARLKAGKL